MTPKEAFRRAKTDEWSQVMNDIRRQFMTPVFATEREKEVAAWKADAMDERLDP